MADETQNVVLNFTTKGDVEFASTTKEINTVMNNAAKEYKNQVAAMGEDATATSKLSALKQKLQVQLMGAEKRTANLRAEYEKMAKDTNTTADALNKQKGKITDSETAEYKLQNQLNKTNEELKKQGDVSVTAAEKMEKIKAAGEKVTTVGKGMSVGITAPIAAIGAASTKAFSEVDDALDGVISKTGATGAKADGLQKSFNNVAGNGPFELADVGEAIGTLNEQFGLTDKALEDTSTTLLRYAEINNTDVTSSATLAKQAISAYGLANKDLGNVLDVTTKASEESGVAVGDLMQQAITAAPQFKNMGLSFGEGVTMLGKLSKSGVDGTKAMSLLSKASVNYAKDGKTLSTGLKETQEKIMGAKDSTEALTIASDVFGTKGATVMVDAIKRGALNLDGLSKSADGAGGTIKKTFEGTEDPIDKTKTAANNAKLALADISTTLQAMLAPVLDKVVGLLKDFSSWFGKLSPQTKQMIVTIGLVAAAIGPILIGVGKLMSAITSIATGFKALGAVFGPIITAIGSVVSAIGLWPILIGAAVIAVVALIVTHWDQIKKVTMTVFNAIKDFFVQIWDAIKNVFNTVITAIVAFVQPKFEAIKNVVTTIMNGIKTVFSVVWEAIKVVFTVVITAIAVIIGTQINIWKSIITVAMDFIKGVFTKVWDAIKGVFTTVLNAISKFLEPAIKAWQTTIKTVMDAIKNVFSTVWNAIKTVFNTVISWLTNYIKTAIDGWKSVITTVMNAIKTVFNTVWNAIKSVTTTVWNAIKTAISVPLNAAKSLITNVVNGIKTTVSNVWNGIKSVTNTVWSGIKDAISKPMNAAKSLVKGVIDAIKGFFNFKISWPNIPLPHFSINPSGWKIGDLLKGSIPSLGIKWNAEGAIFNKPTIAGMNGGNLQGFGEAGPEAALPLNENTYGQMGKAIAKYLPQNNQPIQLVVDGKVLAEVTAPYTNRSLAQNQNQHNLGIGRKG